MSMLSRSGNSALRQPNEARRRILAVLANQGKVRQGFLKLYGELRHPGVHGKIADDDLQGWADLCGVGLTLLYEIMLARIGYVGPLKDYSKREMPSVDYPPTSASGQGRGSSWMPVLVVRLYCVRY